MEIEIKFPDWVPAIVVEAANFIAAHTSDMPDEVEALLTRLITRSEMKRVWEELGKHKRVDYVAIDAWIHDANFPPEISNWSELANRWRREAGNLRALGDTGGALQFEAWAAAANARGSADSPGPLTDSQHHDRSMALLFCLALGHYCAGLRTVRRADLERFTANLRVQGQPGKADEYKKLAAQAENTPYFVTRQRTDARIEAFVKGLAAETRPMTGKNLYGVLSVLTNVAFELPRDAEYDQDRIRALLR